MELTNAEYKELLGLNKRLLMLIDLTAEFRNNVKQLGSCLKLIKTEQKAVKNLKMPSSSDSLNAVKWKYDDLVVTVKKLKSASKTEALNKASAELDELKQKTEDEIESINKNLNPVLGAVPDSVNELASKLESTAQVLSKKLEKGAQKLGDTISEALNGTVEEIKKRIAGDEN